MKIKLLDANVSNKIAAGEVVERPSSIVKELCENSIDAGATSITIEIRGGGIDYIRITDNGCGMEEDDVKNAFLRHATSKISVAEDLNNINTLGFRGEALASIASVSKIKLTTRTKNAVEGTEIALEGGVIDKFISCGCPDGTVIWVEDLFFNTPARRKFLKRPSQEASYINDVINRLALSHPEVSVKYISEGKTVLRTPGDGLLVSCIRGIYGADVSNNIIPIEKTDRGIKISGFLGNREIQKSNRSWQILFVNGRCVKNDLVSSAVFQGYAGRLNVGKFPFFVLNINLEGNLVDVNVHPTKQEIRFADGLPVFDVVMSAVSSTLIKNQEIPSLFKESKPSQTTKIDVIDKREISSDSKIKKDIFEPISAKEFISSLKEKDTYDTKRPMETEIKVTSPVKNPIPSFNRNDFTVENFKPQPVLSVEKNKEVKEFANFIKNAVSGASDAPLPFGANETESNDNKSENFDNKPENLVSKVETNSVSTNSKAESCENTADLQQTLNIDENTAGEIKYDYKIIGILFDTYIVIEFEDSAYIIDQHAAHERILFERLFAASGENSVSQILMIPRIIKVSPSEQAVLEDLIPHLSYLGYEIDMVGNGSFAVKATPSALEDTDPEKFITSLLTENASIKILHTNELKRSKLMQLACKSAVKAGDKLSDNDIKLLLDLIVRENVPLSCPHGRPILIKLSKHELEVRFKRIQ